MVSSVQPNTRASGVAPTGNLTYRKAAKRCFIVSMTSMLRGKNSPHVRIEVASIETQWEAQMKEASGTIWTSI